LDLKRASFEFHRRLESPGSFFAREWKTAALCAGFFSLAMLAIVAFVDPAFFYPRLQTDPLNYVLKTQAFVRTGSTTAQWAVNLKPFAYVAMPGMLRLPAIAAFADFDDQLRAMQVLNIPIVAGVALLSAYVFSWALPKRRHWLAIVFAFGFTFLSPIWLANVYLPLADAPYALTTLGALLVAIELLCSDRPASRRPLLILTFTALFVVSFMLRFTAPVILAFVAVLGVVRWRERGMSRAEKITASVIVAGFILLLATLNAQAITGRYLREPFSFLLRGEKAGMLLNLLGAALPSQVLPSFQLGFMHPPIQDTFHTKFSSALPDMLWAAFGVCISLVLLHGMWRSRSRLLPEIVYVLGALPLITLMMPSTGRYLMTYQPFLWIFFFTGASWLAERHAPWLVRLMRSRLAVASFLLLAVAVVAGLRSWKVAGTASERYFAVTMKRVPEYVRDVSVTFRSLRGFIETLPKDSALLVGSRGTFGRWTAIAGRNYYYPDPKLPQTVREKEVYLLIECGTLEACQAWDIWKTRAQNRVRTFGDFRFDSVFATQSGWARAEVLRMRMAN
jgi:hypothetical protein